MKTQKFLLLIAAFACIPIWGALAQGESNYKMIDLKRDAGSSEQATMTEQSIVDKDIPEVDVRRLNTFVLIIGNEDYTKYQRNLTSESNVDFAVNDATVFSMYCQKTLGIPAENIKLLTNSISSEMHRGIKWLTSRAEYGGASTELMFYYSGHGFPDMETKEKYIMPVDVSGANVTNGIKVGSLFGQLNEHPTKRVTIFMDACFSGGGRESGLLAAKSVRIKPKNNTVTHGDFVVFSSSSAEQESFFYDEQNHGIFTFYLLKKWKDTQGNVSYGELRDYLVQKVPMKSIDLYYKKQVPEVNVSIQASDKWENWKFNE